MGNNQSIINMAISGVVTTNNPTWISYVIQRVERSSNSIKFFLDGNVKYSNGYYDHVNCDNAYPYYDIRAGDRIEANWYRTEDYNSWHEFTGSDNLVAVRFQQRLRDYAVEVPNSSGRELYHLRDNVKFVLERKVERQGDLVVEYIHEVEFDVYGQRAEIEIWKFRDPSY